MKKSLLMAIVLAVAAISASAYDTTPFQIGIWPSNFQIVPEEINVSGLKINLPFGGNQNITGVDLGLASSSSFTSALQINVLCNRVHEDMSGWQIGLINQDGNANGLIIGALNITDDLTRGIQVGIVNSSLETRGVQIGLVNYTEVMTGFQIGIVNIITESVIPFFPIINFCF